MRRLSYITLLVVSFLFSYSQSITRNVIASQGDWYANSNGSLSWTLGEISVETYMNMSNILTQGFQQPDSLMFTSVYELDKDFIFLVSPNPTKDFVFVRTNSIKEFRITVVDISGREIIKNDNCIGTQKIDMSQFQSGVYLISISNSNKIVYSKTKYIKVD